MDWKAAGKGLAAGGLGLLGNVLAGPAGAQVGGMLAQALGLTDSTPDAISRAIASDPAVAAKAREFELQHETELRNLQLEELRVSLGDVASARSREVDLAKATGRRDYNAVVLGWFVVVGFFSVLAVLFRLQVPQENLDVALVLVGQMSGAFAAVIGYNFGTTVGSARKTALLASR